MLKEYLSNLANALRTVLGTTDKINAQDFTDKVNEVYEAGKKAERSEFWDAFQNFGQPQSYIHAFSYDKFNDDTYNPKYDINIMEGNTTGQYMYRYNDLITDTKVIIDASACAGLQNVFENNYNLETIRKLVVSEKITSYYWCFRGCYELQNIEIGGIIGANIDFSSCSKLTNESLISIINALKDLNRSEETKTLTIGDTNLAKLTDTEKAIATQKGWTLA